jgi:hypothetical protein
MKNRVIFSLGISLLLGALSVQAQNYFNISPLTGFANNGWLAPSNYNGSTYAYLTTGNTERGLAFGNGHLYLVARGSSSIRILNPLTGLDLGGLDMGSGIISGGTYTMNMIAVGGDGAIYLDNLTTQSSTTPFRVYRWANEGATPTVAYNGTPIVGGRVGDTFAAIGSGSSTLLAAGFNSSPSVTGNNGFSIIDPTAGTATQVSFAGTPPSAGDFRLGLTFTDSSHVYGDAGTTFRYASFSGSSGTLESSFTPLSSAERPLGYTTLAGHPLLAAISTADNHVSVYDLSDPTNPLLLGQGNATTGTLAANANGTGAIAWGTPVYDPVSQRWSENLYAMSSNDGIQAFVVTIPEPGSFALAALGAGFLAFWRRLRK